MKVQKKITNTYVDENRVEEKVVETTTEKMKLKDVVAMFKDAVNE